MKIGTNEIRVDLDYKWGIGSPHYAVVGSGRPPEFANVPSAWADTEVGAICIALGSDYVQAVLEGDADKIRAAEAAVILFCDAVRSN